MKSRVKIGEKYVIAVRGQKCEATFTEFLSQNYGKFELQGRFCVRCFSRVEFTDAQLIEISKKYTHLTAWRREDEYTRQMAYYRGEIYHKCTAHLIKKKKYLDSDASIIKTFGKYKTKTEIMLADSRLVTMAIRRGIYSKCTEHMPKSAPRRKIHFTTSEILKSVVGCESLTAWSIKHYHQYRFTRHFKKKLYASIKKRLARKTLGYYCNRWVYVFEFSDKVAYVGTTKSLYLRKLAHLKFGPVKEHLATCQNYEFKQVAGPMIDPVDAIRAEQEWHDRYKLAGWTMLNKMKCCSIGGCGLKWTKTYLADLFIKFTCKRDLYVAYPAEARYAKCLGIFNKLTTHMPMYSPRRARST